MRDSHFVADLTGIRSFFLSVPSAALVYGGNYFYANSTHVIGGSQLGPNQCGACRTGCGCMWSDRCC